LWPHPYEDGKEYTNVLFGAALTNYPFLLNRTALHSVKVWTSKGDWEGLNYATMGDAELYTLYEALRKEA
jgi:hypothetical protein